MVSDSRKNKRKELDEEYKKNRTPMPDFIKQQFKLTDELLEILDIPNITLEGYESDDIIYNICKKLSFRK